MIKLYNKIYFTRTIFCIIVPFNFYVKSIVRSIKYSFHVDLHVFLNSLKSLAESRLDFSRSDNRLIRVIFFDEKRRKLKNIENRTKTETFLAEKSKLCDNNVSYATFVWLQNKTENTTRRRYGRETRRINRNNILHPYARAGEGEGAVIVPILPTDG